jgi:hypothetical protein
MKWLDRHQARQSFDRRFTARQMTEKHLQTCDTLLERTQGDLAMIQSAARLRNRLDETTNRLGLVENLIWSNPGHVRQAGGDSAVNLGTLRRAFTASSEPASRPGYLEHSTPPVCFFLTIA